tara:strand:+ start:297 stop:536 length:240 start_codon:yes stop_codon:yes gene_type:complete
MKSDLVKIVEDVWREEDLHSGTYKIAALTCLQRFEEKANQRVIEELEEVEHQLYDEPINRDLFKHLYERIKELKLKQER